MRFGADIGEVVTTAARIAAGDDADAGAIVSVFAGSLGFAPVDLGGLRAGRLTQVGGGPLSGLHLVKVA